MAKYLFPSKMEPTRQKQLLDVMSKALCSIKELSHASFLRGDEISSLEKQFLFEHFLFLQGLQEACHKTEGFIIDDSGKFLAVLNLKDHLQIQLIDCGQDLENGFAQILRLESELGKMFEWSYNTRFGFLTADPRHCGTGLVARLFLHLPALITSGLLKNLVETTEGIEATNMSGGSIESCIGDIVVISNHFTLGLSEDEIVRSLRISAAYFIGEEKRERQKLSKDDVLKNRISRAYGLLLHSYQAETEETLASLSLCKLAIDMGLLKGIDHQKLNALFFDSRKAHVLSLHTEAKDEEVTRSRAKLVHEAFALSSLLI